MKIKILITFFSVIYSVAASTEQRLKLKQQRSSLALTAKQQASVADRKLKVRQAFEALPVDTSFDDLLGPTPPERKHSQILRSGSLKAKKSFVSADDDRGMAAPPIAMRDFISGQKASGGPVGPTFSMQEWIGSSPSTPPSPKKVLHDESPRSVKPIPANRGRLANFVFSRLRSQSPTTVSAVLPDTTDDVAIGYNIRERPKDVPTIVFTRPSVELSIPVVATGEIKKSSPLNKLARAARAKIQRAGMNLLDSRKRLKSSVDDRITDLVNNRLSELGADAALGDLVLPLNNFLEKEFGTTLADYNIPKRLAEEAKKQAIAKSVEKTTGLIKREHAITVMNAGKDAMQAAKGAVRKLGAEMGVTPELKAQMRAELTSFKKTLLQAKKNTFDAIDRLQAKQAPEE